MADAGGSCSSLSSAALPLIGYYGFCRLLTGTGVPFGPVLPLTRCPIISPRYERCPSSHACRVYRAPWQPRVSPCHERSSKRDGLTRGSWSSTVSMPRVSSSAAALGYRAGAASPVTNFHRHDNAHAGRTRKRRHHRWRLSVELSRRRALQCNMITTS